MAMDDANFFHIDKALKEGRLTIIFGAGVTIGAIKTSTVPRIDQEAKNRMGDTLKWSALILGGLQYLENGENDLDASEREELNCYKKCLSMEEVAPGTMLRAATFMRSKLSDNQQFKDFLEDRFRNLYDDYIGQGRNVLLDSIRELHDTKARIITTNYDDLISRHCQEMPITPDEDRRLRNFFWSSREDIMCRRILHLHGLWSEPQSIVIDPVDYHRITNHQFLQWALQTCLGGNEVLLFVGTGLGLEDPNFSRLMKWADRLLGKERPAQYILLQEKEKNPYRSLRAIRFRNYEQLPQILHKRAQKAQENMETEPPTPTEPFGTPVLAPYDDNKGGSIRRTDLLLDSHMTMHQSGRNSGSGMSNSQTAVTSRGRRRPVSRRPCQRMISRPAASAWATRYISRKMPNQWNRWNRYKSGNIIGSTMDY